MKSRIVRDVAKTTLFAATLLIASLFGSPANAQVGFRGRFSLPYEAHWGDVALPAGDYQITFIYGSVFTTVAIRDAKTRRIVALEPVNIREDSKGESSLLIHTSGSRRVVYGLRIAELGEAFLYEDPRARGGSIDEVSQAQTIPVLWTKK
jgi:hypothetical protein